MGDVNLEIKLNNIDERVIKIEESGGSGGDGYITSEVGNQVIDTEIALCDLSEEIDSRIIDIEVALCDLSESGV